MKIDYTLEIYHALQLELEKQTGDDPKLDHLFKSICIVRSKTIELEAYLKANPLSDIAEQVLYFKKVYPLFFSQLIYYTESYNLERHFQLLDRAQQLIFLKEEVNQITHFFKKNSFLYDYYKLNISELDAVYFSNEDASKSHLLSELPAIESTRASLTARTLSRIMALERLKLDIEDKLNEISSGGDSPGSFGANKSRLKWTGESINLVELAYGIWLTGQINHGNASIAEIVQFLESHLNVQIGRPYRRWSELARRKNLSPTKYIDQLQSAIQKRLDDENSLD